MAESTFRIAQINQAQTAGSMHDDSCPAIVWTTLRYQMCKAQAVAPPPCGCKRMRGCIRKGYVLRISCSVCGNELDQPQQKPSAVDFTLHELLKVGTLSIEAFMSRGVNIQYMSIFNIHHKQHRTQNHRFTFRRGGKLLAVFSTARQRWARACLGGR